MRIDPAGWPFVIGGLIVALIGTLLLSPIVGAILLALSCFFLFFFRDPERTVVAPPGTVVSPADGRVMVAGPPTGQQVPAGTWQQITIFLSPMDVHVNRMPIDGTVVSVAYHPGRFLPAYRADAGDLNEHTEVVLDHNGQQLVVRQIVGVLARRIVCRAKPGDRVRTGDRFGVMKFGSRMDVFVPPEAQLHVRVGQRVTAAVTALATLAPLDGTVRGR